MNERIKELMAQAGFDPDAIQRMGVMPQAEKFAELIVAECIEVFSKDLPEEGDGRMLEVVNRVCDVADHFGVEE